MITEMVITFAMPWNVKINIVQLSSFSTPL